MTACRTANATFVVVTSPGDSIVGLAGTDPASGNVITNDYSSGETPSNVLDNNLGTKFYTGGTFPVITPTSASGIVVTPSAPSIVSAISFATANDSKGRDPLTFVIQGSNDSGALNDGNSSFTTIYSGSTGLDTDPGRNAQGPDITFSNSASYASYRVLFTSTRPDDPSVSDDRPNSGFQLSEVTIGTPEPTSLALLGVIGIPGLLARRRQRA